MPFKKKTIRDIDLKGKTVLVRADYNVPVEDGKITDDYRIKQSLPTLEYLIDQNCKIIICSHLGRPEGQPSEEFSLKPVAERLGELLKKPVEFSGNCIGEEAKKAKAALKAKQLLLLENLRFYPGEEANDKDFAKALADGVDVFVQDGFGVVHRAHASTEGVTRVLPSVAGFIVEKEVSTITDVMEKPERPLVAVIGGSKISDKIDVLNRFMEIADFVAVGGVMANTFLLAEGIKIGESLADKNDVPLAKEIIRKAKKLAKEKNFIFYLPQDGVVASKIDEHAKTRIVDWSAHVIASVENYPKTPPVSSGLVAAHEKILDIGPFSGAFIAGGIQLAKTVVWNGTMGITEVDSVNGPIGPFAHGTDLLIDAILGEYGNKPFSVVGGGDTVGYVQERKLAELFNHVSTGGGASLELMSGKKLPGVEALENK